MYLQFDEVGKLFHSSVKSPLRLPVLRQQILIGNNGKVREREWPHRQKKYRRCLTGNLMATGWSHTNAALPFQSRESSEERTLEDTPSTVGMLMRQNAVKNGVCT